MHPLTKEATHEKESSLSRTVSTWEPCSGELTGREGRCALPVLVTSLNLTHTMSKVRIRPDLLRQFGPAGDAAFVLVVTAELLPDVELEARTSYREQSLLVLPQAEPLESFIAASVPEPAHLLVIAPGRVVTSPRDIGRRKMLVVPCGSTPSSVASIAASIRAADRPTRRRRTSAPRRSSTPSATPSGWRSPTFSTAPARRSSTRTSPTGGTRSSASSTGASSRSYRRVRSACCPRTS